MHKVLISVDLPDADYVAYQQEAQRQGVTAERLLEKTVRNLLQELEHEEEEGTDHPIIIS